MKKKAAKSIMTKKAATKSNKASMPKQPMGGVKKKAMSKNAYC